MGIEEDAAGKGAHDIRERKGEKKEKKKEAK